MSGTDLDIGRGSVRRRLRFFFSTLVTGPRRSWTLKMSDTRVYEPQTRARLVAIAHLWAEIVLKLVQTLTSVAALSAAAFAAWWRAWGLESIPTRNRQLIL